MATIRETGFPNARAARRAPRLWLAAAAGVAALLLYWLNWSGLPHAVDEMSALSVSESMLAGDGFRTDQMEWDQQRTPPQNIRGRDGHLYSKKGLGVSLAALPAWALGRAWGQGRAGEEPGAVRLALLTGPLLAALAVGALVYAARALGYGTATALLGGAALGFGTLLWPYARTLFSEAVAAPGLALALAGALAARHRGARGGRWVGAVLICGAGLALLTLAKSSNAVIAPAFYLYLAWAAWQGEHEGRAGRSVRTLVALSLPFGAAVLVTVAYNYARFGTLLSFPLEAYEQFNTPLWTGLAGLLLSPGKGLFWYVPLLWLAVAGAIWLWAVRPTAGLRRADALLALACIVAPLLLYALWYDWPGGRAWGPRMIAWVTPAVALLALPLLDWIPDRRRPLPGRLLVALLLLAGVAVQAPGVLLNFEAREALDMRAGLPFDALLWDVRHAPLRTYWAAFGTDGLEPLLLQPVVWTQGAWLLAWAACTLLAVGALWLAARRRAGAQNMRGAWAGLLVAALLALAAGLVLAVAGGDDPRWQESTANPADNAAVEPFLDEQASPGDLLLLDLLPDRDPQPRGWWRLNSLPAGPSAVGWPRRAPLTAEDEALLARLLAGRARLWLLMVETPEGDPQAALEQFLDQHSYRGRSQWLGAQRVVEYIVAAEPAAAQGAGAAFDGLVLESYRLAEGRRSGLWALDLEWGGPAAPEVRFSLQALDAAGRVVAQVDRPPAQAPGFRDRIGLSAPPFERLILKLYNAETGQTLPLLLGGESLQIDPAAE